MNRECYMRVLSKYYEIENNTNIRLGYREGKDKLHLVIGKRRDRYIENVDAKYLYIVRAEKNEYDRYQVADYQKIKATKVDDEYVIDVQELLKKLKLNYRELDSKEFARTKKFEKRMPGECIYPYAYRYYGKSWMDIDVYYLEADYLKKAFFIGEREVCSIRGETFDGDSESFMLLKKSCEKKTSMNIDEFAAFLKDAKFMNSLTIEWKNATISKSVFGNKWLYEACLDNGEEEEVVSYSISTENEQAGVILYRMLSCTNYEQYNNLINKMNLLGM